MNIELCRNSVLLGSREIVRRFSARARSRSRPTTPKPSATNSEKMIRRSSSRFSRASHGSHKRDRGDVPNESADSVSKVSMRSSVQGSRAGSGKSHVVELDERYNHRIGMQHVPDFIVMLCTTLKALSHGAIFLATCNAVLLLSDVKIDKYRFPSQFPNIFLT